MRIMLFDTETTGLPLWREPSHHPGQPHLVQFTAMICDGAPERETDFVNLFVRPNGWIIPEEIVALHGVTNERALAEGIDEHMVVGRFLAMIAKADLLCAYGVDFDMRIMRIAMRRAGFSKDACDTMAGSIKTHCVMRQATPLAQVPPTDKMMASGRKTWKTPTLTEAVRALLGEELEDAHDARVDVLSTARLYFHMNERRQKELV